MKKIIPIVIIGIVIIAAGGFLIFKKVGNDSTKQPTEQNVSEENSGEDQRTVGEMFEKLSGIKDGESMKCVYKIKMGDEELQSETYVEGKKFKSIAVTDAEEGTKTYMIFDGETQYSWAEGQKEGFKMSKTCAEELGKEFDEYKGEDSTDSTEVAEIDDIFEDAVDVDCKPTDKIDFTIPSGIIFVDQCQMLKDQIEQLEELGGALPQGFIIPEVQEYE